MRLRLLFSLTVLAAVWWLAGRPGADALMAFVEGAGTPSSAPRAEAADRKSVV